jgi:glycosyltransferase involved in cell wall biosynthesis
MLRVKNEERWLERCLRSIAFCRRVIVLDDHSTDRTAEIARSFDNVLYHPSPFHSLQESRDRNTLLMMAATYKPDWIVCPDGDEAFTRQAVADFMLMTHAHPKASETEWMALAIPVLYLWNNENTVRMDGVYSRIRPLRAFQWLPGMSFRAGTGPYGFHCTLITHPKARTNQVHLGGPILHYGYMDAADRARKMAFYRQHDPENQAEDNYRHINQGDPGGAPATATLKHGGPLLLQPLQ